MRRDIYAKRRAGRILFPALLIAGALACGFFLGENGTVREAVAAQAEPFIPLLFGEKAENTAEPSPEPKAAPNSQRTAEAEHVLSTLAALREVFPNGKYWNHNGLALGADELTAPVDSAQLGMDAGDIDLSTALMITGQPCAHSTGINTCNVYAGALRAYYPEYNGTQCFGYASLLSDLLFGVDAPITVFKELDQLRVGDIINYPNRMHTMVVTACSPEDSTVLVTQVNGDYETCRIDWDVPVQLETVAEGGDYVLFTRYGSAE